MIDILPEPIEWIAIPSGRVTLEKGGYVPETGQTFPVEAFQIAKYPITNAQYGKYVEAGGEKPRYWDEEEYNQPLQPVVGVSWYEAIAFCEWLSKQVEYTVTLPTEQQWQRAAQGDDGRAYPWGNEFDKSKANTFESGIRKPTPVTKYAGGASPYGVMDMVGNSVEWCLNDWYTGSIDTSQEAEGRMLSGGSFYCDAMDARFAWRYFGFPDFRADDYGFRVCTSFVGSTL